MRADADGRGARRWPSAAATRTSTRRCWRTLRWCRRRSRRRSRWRSRWRRSRHRRRRCGRRRRSGTRLFAKTLDRVLDGEARGQRCSNTERPAFACGCDELLDSGVRATSFLERDRRAEAGSLFARDPDRDAHGSVRAVLDDGVRRQSAGHRTLELVVREASCEIARPLVAHVDGQRSGVGASGRQEQAAEDGARHDRLAKTSKRAHTIVAGAYDAGAPNARSPALAWRGRPGGSFTRRQTGALRARRLGLAGPCGPREVRAHAG